MTGFYGKLPSYGDFVRRKLPPAFVEPWDDWLQARMAGAMQAMGGRFADDWTEMPAWRFHLPAGACGAAAAVGVLIASEDSVGREYPLTLAALLPPGAARPPESWFDALESAGRDACDHGWSVDQLEAILPDAAGSGGGRAAAGPATPEVPEAPEAPGTDAAVHDPAGAPALGWWTRDGRHWALDALPDGPAFLALMRGRGAGQTAAADGPSVRAVTHRGAVRKRNEDAFVDRGDIGLWAVADGAGGHGAGDIASAAVADALARLPGGLSAAEVLAQVRTCLADVHADLQARTAASAEGLMPATTVVVLMARDGHFACLWAGDSRAYLVRDGEMLQLTEDHSLLQEMLNANALTPEQAENHPQANVITRAVGGPDELALDKVAGRLQPGDRVLLCTDGLFKALPEATIGEVLAAGGGPEELLQRCLEAGARDNVTALVVSV